VKKASVYTRGGDMGETSLVSGNRISKGDERIDLYGEVDELNSFLGFACSELEKIKIDSDLYTYTLGLQSRLFDLGSNLACEKELQEKYKLPQINDDEILKMEAQIDLLNSSLKPIQHFVMPGGEEAASRFHICRTVCRRVERSLVRFENHNPGELPDNAVVFINRLSDFLFIVSRYVNTNLKREEILWIP
jgi:cob(I)alamin adenosyltransferase